MSMPASIHVSPGEYLARERLAPFKSEYFNGEIFAMAGGTLPHAMIAGNLFVLLSLALKGKRCRPPNSDMRQKVEATGLYTYPDLSVVCGEQLLDDTFRDTLLNPTVLIEVLSHSSESYHRGEKFAHYRRIPTLQDYLLVAQDRPRVERFTRQSEGDWLLSTADEFQASIEIASIGCRFSLADVYEGVQLVEVSLHELPPPLA